MSIQYKIKPYNNENDPKLINQNINNHNHQNKPPIKLENNKKLSQLRKDYIKKLQHLQSEHKVSIDTLKTEFQKQKNQMKQIHVKQMFQKDQYIKILQGLVKGEDVVREKRNKHIVYDDKYIFTEQYSKNYVPFYQDIENKIDFKIEHGKKDRNFSMSRNKATNRYDNDKDKKNQKTMTIKSLSHHKLIPKTKPEPSSEISSFKLLSDTYKLKHQYFAN